MASVSSNDAHEEEITVCMRVRPMLKHEKGQGKGLICTGENRIEMSGGERKTMQQQIFTCSRVFGPECSQADVFHQSGVKSLLTASLRGFQSTLFGYGPTGCGKTFTVLGDTTKDKRSLEAEGIVPRSIREMFQQAEHLSCDRDIKMRVSALEIYREVIHDLLVGAASRSPLRCREHPKYGFFVDGLDLKPCSSLEEGLRCVMSSLRNRHTGTHLLNERSSRSHCLLTVHVDSLPKKDDSASSSSVAAQPPPTYGSMCFCDLAGSERPKQTGSSGETLREAGHINKSLYTLGKVIKAMLSSKSRRGVPFRDSNLTKLLIGSLGGTSKALMIGCVSPASSCVVDSARTFEFANQVKGIKNRPVVQLDPREKLISDLKAQIGRLVEENEKLRQDLMENTAVAAAASNNFYFDENGSGRQIVGAATTNLPSRPLLPMLPSPASSSSPPHPPPLSSSFSLSAPRANKEASNRAGERKEGEAQVEVGKFASTARVSTLTDASSPTHLPNITAQRDVGVGEHDGGDDDNYEDEDERLERELEEQLANQLFDQLQFNTKPPALPSRDAPVEGGDDVNGGDPWMQRERSPANSLPSQQRSRRRRRSNERPAPPVVGLSGSANGAAGAGGLLPQANNRSTPKRTVVRYSNHVRNRSQQAAASKEEELSSSSPSLLIASLFPRQLQQQQHQLQQQHAGLSFSKVRPVGHTKSKTPAAAISRHGLFGAKEPHSRDAMKVEMDALVQDIRNRNRPVATFNF